MSISFDTDYVPDVGRLRYASAGFSSKAYGKTFRIMANNIRLLSGIKPLQKLGKTDEDEEAKERKGSETNGLGTSIDRIIRDFLVLIAKDF